MKRAFHLGLTDVFGEPIPADDMGPRRIVDAINKWLSQGMPADKKDELLEGIKRPPQLTLARACVNALTQRYEDERNIDGETLLKRYRLASRIHKTAEKGELVELDSSDMDTIKKQLIKFGYNAHVYGAACEILDTDPTPPEAPQAEVHEHRV